MTSTIQSDVDVLTGSETDRVSGEQVIRGSGGGKGGGTPYEAPTSLRSNARARIIDLLSEGPIEGLVDGKKSIYFDRTPLEGPNGTLNFNGISVATRNGTSNQRYIPRFPAVEREINVGTEITASSPVTRSITDREVDAIRLKLGINGMYKAEDDGDVRGTSVSVDVFLVTNSGAENYVRTCTISGKTNSTFEREYIINLPDGQAPWTIKLVRTTPDSDTAKVQNQTFFKAYTELVYAKLSYPDCALVAFDASAKEFGGSVPDRRYHIRGLKTPVPSNYDPVSKTYLGIWDGTFKTAWHSNPAWVMYALMTNKRYGLGDFFDPAQIDKFALYEIGKYCDERVPDGRGGTEPRFVFNGALRDREEAAKVLDLIASTFRGMIYFGAGAVTAVQDAPKTVSRIVTNANVLGGEFRYSGSPVSSRHSSVAVKWSDPNQLGDPIVTILQNDDLIAKFGERRKEVLAYGCTSLGQAQRMARWLLYTEAYETELISYEASFDHMDVRPGDLIEVWDNAFAGLRNGGRIKSASATSVVLDHGIEFRANETYGISLIGRSGNVIHRTLHNPGVKAENIHFTEPLSSNEIPKANTTFIVSSSEVKSRLFRVISVAEKSKNTFEVSGVIYFPDKFNVVDNEANAEESVYSVYDDEYINSAVLPPSNISVAQFLIPASGTKSRLKFLLSWTLSPTPGVMYEVSYRDPDFIWTTVPLTSESSIEIVPNSPTAGMYHFQVRAIGRSNHKSDFISTSTTVYSEGLPPARPSGWLGIGAHNHIELMGDAARESDFKEFRIYARMYEGAPENLIGTSSVPSFIRTVDKDTLDNEYSVSSATHAGLESSRTGWMLVERLPADFSDLDPSVKEQVDEAFAHAQAAQDRHKALVGDFTGTLEEAFGEIDLDGNAAILDALRGAYEGVLSANKNVAVNGNFSFEFGWSEWATSSDLTADQRTLNDIETGEIVGNEADTLFIIDDSTVLAIAMREAEQLLRTK